MEATVMLYFRGQLFKGGFNSTNPGLKCNLLFLVCVFLHAFLYVTAWENKTPVDQDKISRKIFPCL
jgi:uncharacterized RDD family membrane protein YckC